METLEKMKLVSYLKLAVHNKDYGNLVNVYVSGSNLYGWNSKDSDIDVRGSFISDKRKFLGLSTPKDVLELKNTGQGDLDVVLFEVKKTMGLILKGDCNRIEGLFAPQIYTTSTFLGLKEIVEDGFESGEIGKRGLYGSYKGMAMHNYKKFILGETGKTKGCCPKPQKTVKKYLYIFRGLLSGRYVLDNHAVESNMDKLLKCYRIPEVKELLRIKKAGKEQEKIPETVDDGTLDNLIVKQIGKIDEAYQNCTMNDRPSEDFVKALNDFLVKERLYETSYSS